ncbi:MAG TPA: hypothetical protein PKJ63_01550 [Cyclobacteriaceae bacterium]|nr:hypothetical protein [Cyclobacteriaceae bacterium]
MTNIPDKVTAVYIDLMREKSKNRTIVIGTVVLCSVISLFSLLFAYLVYRNETQTQYAVTADGNVSKLERVNAASELPQEAMFHCQYMFHTYYTFDFTNLNAKREAGLWLVDSRNGTALEEKWKPWFNNILSQNLQQKAYCSPEDGNDEYYEFFKDSFKFKRVSTDMYQVQASVKVVVSNKDVYNLYELTIFSNLKRVSRDFPRNPHGFVFYNYRDELVELKTGLPIK